MDSRLFSRHRQILAWTPERDNINGFQFRAGYFRDAAYMAHLREMVPGDGDRVRFDVRSPYGADTVSDSGQRETTQPVEQTSHSNLFHSFLLAYSAIKSASAIPSCGFLHRSVR